MDMAFPGLLDNFDRTPLLGAGWRNRAAKTECGNGLAESQTSTLRAQATGRLAQILNILWILYDEGYRRSEDN
ncbi:MAG: hypothetical protein ABI882_24350, partial [Acidobacteriota bacterium]